MLAGILAGWQAYRLDGRHIGRLAGILAGWQAYRQAGRQWDKLGLEGILAG